MKLTILSLNLAGYKDWTAREAAIVQALNQTNADILLLQEVRFDPAISSYSQANYINSLLDAPYAHSVSDVTRFYTPSVGEPYREGLAILSKFPLSNPETLALTKAADDKHTRIIQTVDVDVDGTVVGITNVHFSNNQYSTEQLGETLRILAANNRTSVIAGDFNVFDIDKLRASFDTKYTVSTDVTGYVSFPSENVTLDYILVPKAFRFANVTTIGGLSDHAGILAVIETMRNRAILKIMEDSIFTKIIKGEILAHKVYEDDLVLAFLDIHPVQPGHVLVIPKKQIEFVWDLPDEDYDAVMKASKKIALHLRETLGVRYVGERIVGVDVPHAHVQLIPFNTVAEYKTPQDMTADPDHVTLGVMAEKLRL